MIAYMRDLLRQRELLLAFARRDIKVKYKQSLMGVLWALLMPMIIVCAGVLVNVAAAHYSRISVNRVGVTSVAVKAVAWAFFVSALRFGTNSLIGNASIVTKIKFPKLVFPMASILSAAFDLCVGGAAVAVFVVAMGLPVNRQVLWVPLLVVLLVLLVFGLTALLAVGNLFFRDVKYIVDVIVTFAVFFTPVFYDAAALGRWRRLILLNPVAPLLEGLSATVIHGRPPPLAWTAYSAGVAVVLAVLAVYAFTVLEPTFAEHI